MYPKIHQFLFWVSFFLYNLIYKNFFIFTGSGNSLLSEQLFNDGFRNIHNIDISETVIRKMANHCDKCKKMQWYIMDCRYLTFQDHTFDVILEKATLDVFLVGEKSPWNISNKTIRFLTIVSKEIIRVLKKETGQFFSITFSMPHFRQLLFEKIFDNSIKMTNIHQLGIDFNYFLYHLTNNSKHKSLPLFRYQPPTVTLIKNETDIEDNEEDFLYKINL